MVAREWLDSFNNDPEMLIGRLSQMSPPPCLYDTVIQSYVQSEKAVSSSMGNFGTLLPPQGCKFYPIVWYVLTEPVRPLQMWQFHISTKSTL